jgi:hypothetical protein
MRERYPDPIQQLEMQAELEVPTIGPTYLRLCIWLLSQPIGPFGWNSAKQVHPLILQYRGHVKALNRSCVWILVDVVVISRWIEILCELLPSKTDQIDFLLSNSAVCEHSWFNWETLGGATETFPICHLLLTWHDPGIAFILSEFHTLKVVYTWLRVHNLKHISGSFEQHETLVHLFIRVGRKHQCHVPSFYSWGLQ